MNSDNSKVISYQRADQEDIRLDMPDLTGKKVCVIGLLPCLKPNENYDDIKGLRNRLHHIASYCQKQGVIPMAVMPMEEDNTLLNMVRSAGFGVSCVVPMFVPYKPHPYVRMVYPAKDVTRKVCDMSYKVFVLGNNPALEITLYEWDVDYEVWETANVNREYPKQGVDPVEVVREAKTTPRQSPEEKYNSFSFVHRWKPYIVREKRRFDIDYDAEIRPRIPPKRQDPFVGDENKF